MPILLGVIINMITKARAVAKQIVEKGYNIVPLFPNSKETHDHNWIKKRYSIDDVLDDSNIGINLGLSNLLDIDLDCDLAIHFGLKFLPYNTLKLGREFEDGTKQITHYFFLNNGSLKDNDIKKFKGNTILEYRCSGQTVVYGQTPSKDNPQKMVKRYWVDETKPIFQDNLQQIVNKIYFAVAICSYKIGANLGALKLDACIMRYTDWTDTEREEFLWEIVRITDPNSKDCTLKKVHNHIKSNNKETKNSGYQSLADHIGADAKELKNIFSLIGSIPSSDNHEKVKSIIDFNEKSLNMEQLMSEELPPMKWTANGILPEGFGTLAGRPKAMKSWTMLKLCIAVQNGFKFLGHETVQGDCIYFGLEDSKRRIKSRIQMMQLTGMKMPQVLLGGDVPYIGYGFEECLENWIQSKPNPRLVVIDTLARLKPRQSKNGGTAYDQDNLLLNAIQKLAVQNNLTVLFVTHLSKASQDYSFDKIQGSVGIQGMTDFMWMLDRGDGNDKKASLIGRGRDILDFEYALKWNDSDMSYEWEGNLVEITKNENRQDIVNAMREISKEIKEIRPRDVCKHYGVSANSKEGRRLARTMQRMADQYELIKGSKYGTYIFRDYKEKNGEDVF